MCATHELCVCSVEGFSFAFPYLMAGWHLAIVSQRARYLFGLTVHSHPLLAALDVALVRSSALQPPPMSSPPGIAAGSVSTLFSSFTRFFGRTNQSPSNHSLSSHASPPSLSSSSNDGWDRRMVFLLISLVAIRALDWTFRSELDQGNVIAVDAARAASSATAAGQLVMPSPIAPKVARGCLLPPSDPSLCPLCRKQRDMPCASTGGFVFCYRCLLDNIRGQQQQQQTTGKVVFESRCPISGLPCAETDILRIFEA